jgi:hypothetical protein
MADADRLPALLEEIRNRGKRVWEGRGNVGGLLAIGEAKDDVPRLLAAVEAALAAHPLDVLVSYWQPCPVHAAMREAFGNPVHGGTSYRGERECPNCRLVEYAGCDGCRGEDGHPSRPGECPTRQAITRELLGEEKPGG